MMYVSVFLARDTFYQTILQHTHGLHQNAEHNRSVLISHDAIY